MRRHLTGDARAALRRTIRRDLRRIGLAAALFLGVALFEPYDTSRPLGEAEPETPVRDNVALADRLGYAVLLRAGYAEIVRPEPAGPSDDPESQPVADDDEPNRPPQLATREAHPDFACAGFDEERGVVDAQLLTIALAAVEAYNRRPARQRVETGIAAAALRLSGRLPNYSLGVMQIRPSTARAVLRAELGGTELPPAEVLALLRHRCHSVRLAGQLVRGYRAEAAGQPPAAVIDHVARRYGGAQSVDGRHHWYFEAVRGAYRLLYAARYPFEIDDAPFDPDAAAATPEAVPFCVFFGLGAARPDHWPFLPPDSAGLARLTLVPLGAEPGPPLYAARLRERRLAEVAARLEREGFGPDRVAVGDTATTATAAACAPQPGSASVLVEVRGLLLEPGY